MIADKILGSLTKVKQTGAGRWIACCPSHEDRLPSLAIREEGDRLLVKCFAGCSAEQIVSSIGMEITDLFPEKLTIHSPLSRPFPAADILRCLRAETLFVMVCASDMQRGEVLDEHDHERLRVAISRIHAGVQAGGL